MFLTLVSSQLKNFQAQLNLNTSTGTPYTMLTGRDDNGDLIFNDRAGRRGTQHRCAPKGNGRLSAYFNYSLQFGKRGGALPPGIRIINLNGAPQVDTIAINNQPRFRVGVYVNVQNLTNHYNYAGYSGVHDVSLLRPADARRSIRGRSTSACSSSSELGRLRTRDASRQTPRAPIHKEHEEHEEH